MSELPNQHTTFLKEDKKQRRFHLRSKWNALVLTYSKPLYLATFAEAQNCKRSFLRLGFKAKTKSTNLGFKVWRIDID